MTTASLQPYLIRTGKILLSIGLVIGVILLMLNILQVFFVPSKGLQFNISILEGSFFWGLWSFACYILDIRLSCGKWCLRTPPGSKKFKMSRKTSLYFAILMILILACFAVFEIPRMINDYSDSSFFLAVHMILFFAAVTMMLLFYMSFTEDSNKFKESSVESLPEISQTIASDTIPASGTVAHNGESAAPLRPRFWETFFGLLKNPQPMLVRLRDISFMSSLLYFLAMVVLISIPVALFYLPAALSKPQYGLVFVGSYGIILGGWILFGILTQLIVFFLGGNTSFDQTFRSLFYATTPVAAIGWIPLVGNLGLFWSLYLMKCGLTKRQDIPENTALIAVVTSAVIIVIMFYLLLYLILMGKFHPSGLF